MQFREFAEKLLGSKVKVKLLRILLSEEVITSERELAKMIGVSHGAVNKALKELNEQNLITPIRVGNVIAWQLNKSSYAYDFLERLAENIKSQPIEDFKKNFDKTKFFDKNGVIKIILYGSVAQGTEVPSSDIDIFILVKEKNEEIVRFFLEFDKVCILRFGNKLSPNIFTYKDLSNPKNKKFLENVNKGIIVFER